MSEEEVIKQIKDMIIAFDVQGYIIDKGFIKEELKASNVLQEILDLYNKQKEKIKRFKNEEEYSILGKETLLNEIHKQKEELETEKHYAKVYENMVKDYEKICIEKNKKIEELEEEIDQINKNKWEDWLEENE